MATFLISDRLVRAREHYFHGQRISWSWLEGEGTIFKEDRQKSEFFPESGLYRLHFARLVA